MGGCNGGVDAEDIVPLQVKFTQDCTRVVKGNRRLYVLKMLEKAGFNIWVPIVETKRRKHLTAFSDHDIFIRSGHVFVECMQSRFNTEAQWILRQLRKKLVNDKK